MANNKKSKAAAEVAESVEVVAPVEVKAAPAKKPIIPKDIDVNQTVTVRNGFQGRLVYRSPKTGERYVWSEFGDEQEMDLKELKSAKNSFKKMFINNWFMFDEQWVIDYLGVGMYYKNALKIDEFDSLFKKPASEVEKVVSKLSDGQKKSVAYRAKQLIAEEKIDSIKTINTLEKILGIELIEK